MYDKYMYKDKIKAGRLEADHHSSRTYCTKCKGRCSMMASILAGKNQAKFDRTAPRFEDFVQQDVIDLDG